MAEIVCERCGSYMALASCECDKVFARFIALMEGEIVANREKGGRWHPYGGWKTQEPAKLLAEVHDHAAKLHIATRELIRLNKGDKPRALPWGDRDAESLVKEFAADTANMAMMLCDAFGLLSATRAEARADQADEVS